MIKKNSKEVSSRNYFLVIIVSVLTVALVLYVRTFIVNYKNNVISVSPFSGEVNELNINELEFAMAETSDALIYVSYVGDRDVYNMEKRLLKEIKKKSLNEKIIYINVTDYAENQEYLSILKAQFPDIQNQISGVPMLIYIENGVAKEAYSSELKIIDYKVLNKLIDKYEIE